MKILPNIVGIISLVVVLGFSMVSCDNGDGVDVNRNIESNFWGEWLRIDANETWYITKNSILINQKKTSKDVTLYRQSDNVIQVTEGSRVYYLYASRLPNSSFTGRIAGFDNTSLSLARSVAGGKGWINVVVDNLNNGTSTTTTTGNNGDFIVEDTIPGDEYKITPEGGEPIIFTPIADGDDLGTITVVSGNDVNFKVSIALSNSDLDLNMLTARGYYQTNTNQGFSRITYRYSTTPSYDFTITIQNTGGRDATAATYQLLLDSGLQLESGNISGILGTIEPGRSRSISLRVGCSSGSISGDYAFKKINVTITDPIINRTWTDSVSLRFFKETFMLCTDSSSINGLVILPTNETFRFLKMGIFAGSVLTLGGTGSTSNSPFSLIPESV